MDVRNVVKIFKPGFPGGFLGRRPVHALQGVDLSVYRGEIFGLLGPNGAGKSTLVKILLGLVRPTTLEGSLLGGPIGRRETMARVGYLPEQHRFPPYLTGRQVVEFFISLAGVDRSARRARAAALLDRVGMTQSADRRVNTYSKGMRQRVGLAQALAAAPDLIILDEPTDGVDPLARRDIRDVLVEARHAGASVFVNSHLLGELELICDRVAILVNGRVAQQGTIDELALGSERYEIELATPLLPEQLGQLLGVEWQSPLPPPPPAHLMQAPGGELRAPGQTMPRPQPGTASPFAACGTLRLQREPLALSYDPLTRVLKLETLELSPATAALDAVRQAGLLIRRFTPVRPSLEEMFLTAVAAPEAALRPTRPPARQSH